MTVVSDMVPKHLTSAARTGFLSAVGSTPMPWQQIAMVLNMTEPSVDVTDLGAVSMPTEAKGPSQVKQIIERSLTVKPRDWELTISLTYNAMQDDQTGELERKARGAGRNFQRHINNRVFTVLDAGDSTTYGLCYDGQNFFDNDHVDKGGEYQTNQDNEFGLALSIDNFETVWVAAQGFKDDAGEELGFNYDLLVISPSLFREAQNIIKNEWAYDTVNREINPYMGILKQPIVSPELSATAWFLIASSEEIKPLIVAIREQPNLQSAWFDPNTTEGGTWYWKFYARYEVYYGYWPLAVMGNT